MTTERINLLGMGEDFGPVFKHLINKKDKEVIVFFKDEMKLRGTFTKYDLGRMFIELVDKTTNRAYFVNLHKVAYIQTPQEVA